MCSIIHRIPAKLRHLPRVHRGGLHQSKVCPPVQSALCTPGIYYVYAVSALSGRGKQISFQVSILLAHYLHAKCQCRYSHQLVDGDNLAEYAVQYMANMQGVCDDHTWLSDHSERRKSYKTRKK